MEAQRVSSLISDGQWNESLIMMHFDTYTAGQILDIHFYLLMSQIYVSGKTKAKGDIQLEVDIKLLVDSYHHRKRFLSPPENQSTYSTEKWWKLIWNLDIPTKIRIFWWRLSHNIIPTAMNLRSHHIQCLPNCNLCGFHRDSSIHALFICPEMRRSWKKTEFWSVISGMQDKETLDCCLWFKLQLNKSDSERLATLTWGLWKNKIVFYIWKGKQCT